VLTRAQVLAYRVAVHHLEHPTGAGVLPVGVQDLPYNETAWRALVLRGVDPTPLVRAQTVRAAPHLHRADDLPLFAAALGALQITDLAREHFGPFDEDADLPGAMAHVALAMRQVVADGQPRTKGELSEAVTKLVDPRLAPWCRNCSANHVQDALFRYATLQAELIMDTGPVRYIPMPPGMLPPPPDPEVAQTTLTRHFLRLCGPALPEHLARWLGLRPATARRFLNRLPLVKVEVDGRPASMHPDDLDTLLAAPPPTEVRLLPPHDPLVELADRWLLLPDRAHRAAVWRPVATPGSLLIRGEIVGTWRYRTTTRLLTITVKPFTPVSPADRRAIPTHAKLLTQHPELQVRTKFEMA
jgi:DNA glycosylase AlkZ-like